VSELDSHLGRFLRVRTPDVDEKVLAGTLVERIARDVDPVRDRGRVADVRVCAPLGLADRDEVDTFVQETVVGARLVVPGTVEGVTVVGPSSRICASAGTQERVIMDEVKLLATLVGADRVVGLVPAIANCARPRRGQWRDNVRLRSRPLGGKEGDIMPARMEAASEKVDDQVDPTVSLGRHRNPGWCNLRDPHVFTKHLASGWLGRRGDQAADR
jgi:hypothetical protein